MYGVEVAYPHGLQDAGATPYLVPGPGPGPGAGVSADDVLDGFDGLLVIGGEDLAAEVSGAAPESIGSNADAERDRWELALLAAALTGEMPVLAICRGMQLLNVAFGGTLHGHMTGQSAEHPGIPDDVSVAFTHRHRVDVAAGSRLRAAVGTGVLETNSLHHQAVDRLGAGLVVTGVATDGVVEAVEPATGPWCVGVQWHPELMPDDLAQRALVASFVDTCRARREQHGAGYLHRPLSPTTGRAS
jgi:putative glutamine amidotransferase